jgi:ethanolamine ammonia-lyase small subunit
MSSPTLDSANPWAALRAHTPARIGLARRGVSLGTPVQLAFQLAHAQARDAVNQALDVPTLQAQVQALGLPSVTVHSAAADRPTYLKRPDLGRQLRADAQAQLAAHAVVGGVDLAVVVADGLSALAVQRHAATFMGLLRDALGHAWRWAPVVIVQQGRVAVGDPIGHALGAALVVVLIGERPGLSSPDSMGAYITWAPQPGCTDAQRNCISNIRPEGLALRAGAQRLAWLLTQARSRQLTGVALKDESDGEVAALNPSDSFLLQNR